MLATQSLRAKNQGELLVILDPVFRQRQAGHWLEAFDAKGIPCAPINDFAEILADPHVAANGWVRPLVMPNGTATTTVGFPIGLTDFSFEIAKGPPGLGEHNQEVAAEWMLPDQRSNR